MPGDYSFSFYIFRWLGAHWPPAAHGFPAGHRHTGGILTNDTLLSIRYAYD